MNPNGKWRHEDKYLLSQGQIALLRCRLNGLMKSDANVDESGQYHIRSVYFDDINHSCFHDNKSGTDPREKYRIRIYNRDNLHIKLELKRKRQGLSNKQSCQITLEQCHALINNKIPELDAQSPELLVKLCYLMQAKHYHPVTITDYNRIPYVYPTGNVRITFDYDIASSNYVTRFLDEVIPRRLIMPSGQHMIEVKWDEVLPDYIRQTLQTDGIYKKAFSKYCYCHHLNLIGQAI